MPYVLVKVSGDPAALDLITGPGCEVLARWTEGDLEAMADTVLRLEDGEAVPPDDDDEDSTPLEPFVPDPEHGEPVDKVPGEKLKALRDMAAGVRLGPPEPATRHCVPAPCPKCGAVNGVFGGCESCQPVGRCCVCDGAKDSFCEFCPVTGGPDKCVVCKREATTTYPDDSGEPSCGRAACELRIQAAADYHAERG